MSAFKTMSRGRYSFLLSEPDLYEVVCRGRHDLVVQYTYTVRRFLCSRNKKKKNSRLRRDSIESDGKYGGVGLMLRGRDARAANGGRGMAWMGGYRGRASWCRGMTGGEEWWRETGSRGARWVMLRDEMPRGFIEQRRREEERGRGSLLRWRENATEKERRARWLALL